MTTDAAAQDDNDERPDPMKGLDPVRRLILERSRELRLTLADLNRHVGKNGSYFHQFIWRQRPGRLPEDVRGPIAQLLGLPEDRLRSGPPEAAASPWPALLPPVLAMRTAAPPTPQDVPVYRQTDQIDPRDTETWIARPLASLPVGPMFAVWISGDHGRLQPGDLAFVTLGQAPRRHDTVVALKDKAIIAAGQLTEQDASHVSIHTGRDAIQVELEHARICKVVAVVFG